MEKPRIELAVWACYRSVDPHVQLGSKVVVGTFDEFCAKTLEALAGRIVENVKKQTGGTLRG